MSVILVQSSVSIPLRGIEQATLYKEKTYVFQNSVCFHPLAGN